MGGCPNYGPFLGTLNIRGRIIIGTQKRDHKFDNHPYNFLAPRNYIPVSTILGIFIVGRVLGLLSGVLWFITVSGAGYCRIPPAS